MAAVSAVATFAVVTVVTVVAARGGGGDGWASSVDGVELVLESRGASVGGEHD